MGMYFAVITPSSQVFVASASDVVEKLCCGDASMRELLTAAVQYDASLFHAGIMGTLDADDLIDIFALDMDDSLVYNTQELKDIVTLNGEFFLGTVFSIPDVYDTYPRKRKYGEDTED